MFLVMAEDGGSRARNVVVCERRKASWWDERLQDFSTAAGRTDRIGRVGEQCG
jgi:hypothetical protein